MAVLKSDDNKHFIISCNCGCDESIRFVIDEDDYGYYSFMTFMNGNFARDQNDSIWRVICRKCKKIWAIIRNKDYYYSDVILTKDDFIKFREYMNSINVNK